MNSYQEEIEAFKKDAASEYFKMQMKEEKARSRFYTAAVLLMIFLPILIVGLRTYHHFSTLEKNALRMQKDMEEMQTFAESLVQDESFLQNLIFQNGIAKVFLVDFYNGTYAEQLTKPYFDKKFQHQCLGSFLFVQEETSYRVYTTDYCKM